MGLQRVVLISILIITNAAVHVFTCILAICGIYHLRCKQKKFFLFSIFNDKAIK